MPFTIVISAASVQVGRRFLFDCYSFSPSFYLTLPHAAALWVENRIPPYPSPAEEKTGEAEKPGNGKNRGNGKTGAMENRGDGKTREMEKPGRWKSRGDGKAG